MHKKKLIVVFILLLTILCWFPLKFAFLFGFRALGKAIKSNERVVFVRRSDLESEPGVRVLDANNQFFQVIRMGSDHIDVKWQKTKINLNEPRCRVKKLPSDLVYVTARINGKQYPLLIDSGCEVGLVVNDMVVIDNKLEIFPFETKDSTFDGCCHLDKIEIGDMTITAPPCLYTLNHYETRVLGRTLWKQRQIILGLELLRRFSYVLIDNISSEVEFSTQNSFQVDTVEMWDRYDMSVEEAAENAKDIIIRIPIAGEITTAKLDTGTSWTLAMTKDIWDDYSRKLQVLKESRERAQFFYGLKDVRKVTVSELSIGDKLMTDAPISILADSTFKESFILIGIGYFKDTIIVIDFERGLVWVRKPQPL
jgi:hypothetical protein